MVRRIIKIDEDKCNGCELCVSACHEGAIGMVDGKATLLRDDYCDGLGDCLPVCPTGAITFEERKALPFDVEAVQANMAKKAAHSAGTPPTAPRGCPGSNSKTINRNEPIPRGCPGSNSKAIRRDEPAAQADSVSNLPSELMQWPVQIKLVPVNAPYFDNANLLISADCAAYAYGNFHSQFMKNKVTIIGCPKLDMVDYSEKLTEIIRTNKIKSVTVVRMEVPCCSGIEHAVVNALKNSGKMIPWQIVTISTDGKILD